jgi:hypothetical protein
MNHESMSEARIERSTRETLKVKLDFGVRSSSNAAALEDALQELAQLVARTEAYWQSLSLLSPEFITCMDELRTLGWISIDEGRVAFSHQTKYEFFVEASWADRPNEFVRHVLDSRRLTGLFVRPTVRRTLSRMRSEFPVNYLDATSQLLAESLPRHLRRLMMEFLSEVPDPSATEVGWVGSLLHQPETAVTMCWLLRGKAAWIKALPDSECEFLMLNAGEELAWAAARLLETAWSADEARVQRLLRQHWAYQQSFVNHVWWVSVSASSFNNELLAWLHFCVDAKPEVEFFYFDRTLSRLSESDPSAAFRLIRHVLERRLDQCLAGEDVDSSSEVGGAAPRSRTLSEYIRKEIEDSDWHTISTIASKSPTLFVQILWPWVLRVIRHLEPQYRSRLRRFEIQHDTTDWLRDSQFRSPSIISALADAIRSWAANSPHEVVGFAISNWQTNSMLVHQILCGALEKIAEFDPQIVLTYVSGDERRLLVGRYTHEDSVRLIQAAMPNWSDLQRRKYQQFILRWNMYRDDNGGYIDEFRSRFLSLVPELDRVPEAVALIKTNADEIQREIAREAKLQNLSMNPVQSPISAAEMIAGTDDEVVARIFEQLPVQVSEERQAFINRDGYLVAQTFGSFAVAAPDRALVILQRLHPETHQELAGAALREFAEASELPERIYDFVRVLSAHGYVGQSFRDDCGYALRKVAVREKGLPDDLCVLLEDWLTVDPTTRQRTLSGSGNTHVKDTRKGEPAPILWPHPGGFITYPNEWFWIGEAVKLGYCCRPSHAESPVPVERWIKVFDKCIELPFATDVWEAWLFELLRFCPDHKSVAPSVVQICRHRTDVLHSSTGMIALARFGKWMTTDDRLDFVQRLLSEGDAKSKQGAAELAVFYSLHLEDDAATRLVNELLAKTTGKEESELVGIAFAAAHLSNDATSRDAAVELIARLFPTDVDAVHDAVIHAFHGAEALQNDPATQKLLETIANGIQFRRVRDAYSLVKKLTHFVALNPHLTCRVMRRIVDGFFELKKSASHFHVGYFDDELVNIILTLHRQPDPELREESLTLFEDLMDLEVAGAFEKLKEIDLR